MDLQATKFKRIQLANKAVLFLILSVTIVLRFFNYFDIPFTHDEFSALFRLKFDSFPELIEKGVKVDGHPAGVHVFLYYWTKLFGYQEWSVKLPFTVIGVFSVYLIYCLGKKWFNETVGLVSAAYMATIQFTVMYSQIARPYISGVFFSLLMIHFWTNLMMEPGKRFYKNSLFFIISASLCTYNHHFSLLFAAIVGVSGIFFIQRKFLLRYILSGVLILILYIPHLDVFIYQLQVGGVEEWLGKPRNDFLLQFIHYIFNFSTFALAVVAALFWFGLYYARQNSGNLKLIVLSFVWFILPFLIGFYYSRYVNAVLQYSVLIFSFPMLLFVLFGFIRNQTAKVNLILITIILLTNTLTLIYGRKHYDLFYKSIYKQILTDCKSVKEKSDSTIFMVDSNKGISEYYSRKLNIDTSFVDYSETFGNISELKQFLDTESKTNAKLYLGALSSLSPNVVPLILDYFPFIEIQNNYFGGTTYLFSKKGSPTINTIESLCFDGPISDYWSSIDTAMIIPLKDPAVGRGYLMTSNAEWGPTFSIPLEAVINNKNNFIDISFDIESPESGEGAILVAVLETKSENVYWGGANSSDFVITDDKVNKWQRVHHSIKLSDAYLKHDNIVLKTFIWNRNKVKLIVDNFKINLRRGNPYVYGINEKI